MRSKNFRFKENCTSDIRTNYLTHGIHSYTAKFIPHMPRYFIEKYTKEGEIVLDPFAGSGTTLLEANLLGRNALGIDINPLAVLIGRVKTTSIKKEELEKANRFLFDALNKSKKSHKVNFPNINHWFNDQSIYDLGKIKYVINELYKNKQTNKKLKNFFDICFSSIIRKSSFADPSNPKTYCSPRMRKLKKEGYKFDPIKYFKEAVIKNSKLIYMLDDSLKKFKVKSHFIPTNTTLNIRLPSWTKRVDLIVTSPPYANAQEYFRNFKLELFWLGLVDRETLLKLDKNQIGGENHAVLNYKNLQHTGYQDIDKIIERLFSINKKSSYIVYKYFFNMEKSIKEYARVLKKGGHCVIIIGNNTVRGVKIPIDKTLIEIAKKNGFDLFDYGYDLIKNRKFMTKRNNSAEVIEKDWIIDFVKK
jgi:DNA modification methylase